MGAGRSQEVQEKRGCLIEHLVYIKRRSGETGD